MREGRRIQRKAGEGKGRRGKAREDGERQGKAGEGEGRRAKARGGEGEREVRGRCAGDAREVRGRCAGSAREVRGKCAGDAREMHGRCAGDARLHHLVGARPDAVEADDLLLRAAEHQLERRLDLGVLVVESIQHRAEFGLLDGDRLCPKFLSGLRLRRSLINHSGWASRWKAHVSTCNG